MNAMAEEAARVSRYREKAEECRSLADRMSDRLAREAFLEVGKSYERLADQAEEKLRFMRRAAHG